ncbi:MAG: caspase family protein [Acidobacteria bacterium]|nr:caspase family protein [Acidobacteriota bacterium]
MPRNSGSSTALGRRAAAGLGLLLLAVSALVFAADDEGKRVALIIGNDAYSIGPLKNAVNDARAMDKALRAAGFQTKLLENATKEQMDEALGAFADSLGPDHNALFYYAGHAFQIENENFLIPIDFKPARGITQAKIRCLSLAQLLEELKRSRAKTRVIILDACRGNPIAQTYSLAAGLAQPLNAGRETYIAFSTGPNQVAADNPDGKNSWFTEALADLLSEPGANPDIDEVLTRVRKRVEAETENRQTPWSLSSLTSGFRFRPRSKADTENDPSLAQKWLDDAARRERREDWAEAIDLLNRVVRRKPGGAVEAAAQTRLPYLVARRDAQASFDGSDFARAAEQYQQAFRIDGFSMDAAFQAANSYLLTDRMGEAVGALKAIRVRGTSEAIRKADAMLKELAAVSPEAGQELKTGIPAPPRAEEVFSGMRFGVPDQEAGRKYLRETPVELTRWVNELQAAAAPAVISMSGSPAAVAAPGALAAAPAGAPAAAAGAGQGVPAGGPAVPGAAGVRGAAEVSAGQGVPAAAPAQPTAAPAQPAADVQSLRLEVVALGATRELDYGVVTEDAPAVASEAPAAKSDAPAAKSGAPAAPGSVPGSAPRQGRTRSVAFGFVEFDSLVDDTTVLVNGKPMSGQTPGKLRLPAGNYEIRMVRGGTIVDRQKVEVRPSSTTRIVVKR